MSEEVTKEQATGNDSSIKNADTSAKKQESKAGSTGVDTASGDKLSQKPRGGGARRSFGKRKSGFRKGSRFRSQRPKPEFEQKIINISRVTRVVKGGRRLSFRVDMVIGDKKGRVGLGSGKATDTSLAIQKAFNQARKKILKDISLKKESLDKELNEEIRKAEFEIEELKNKAPEKINKIAIEVSKDLIQQLISVEVNNSSISAIVSDLSKKDKEKYYGY